MTTGKGVLSVAVPAASTLADAVVIASNDDSSPALTKPRSTFQSDRSKVRIIFSFVVTILLALPVWWKTTSIERLPLPRAQLANWSDRLAQAHFGDAATAQHCVFELPIRLHLSIHDSLVEDLVSGSARGEGAVGGTGVAEQTLELLAKLSAESAALLAQHAVAAQPQNVSSAACVRFLVTYEKSVAHAGALAMVESQRLTALEHGQAAKRDVEQLRDVTREAQEERRPSRKHEHHSRMSSAALAADQSSAASAQELRQRLDMHPIQKDLGLKEEVDEAETHLAFAETPSSLLQPRRAMGAMEAYSVLDYRIHLYGEDLGASDTSEAAQHDLAVPISKSERSTVGIAQTLVDNFLHVFPLYCLSAASSRPQACASPAGVESGKAIQHEKTVELVFSLVHEDASDGGAYTAWDIAGPLHNQAQLGSAGQSNDGPHHARRRRGSASVSSVEEPRAAGNLQSSLSDILDALSEQSIHDFKIETQMLFYAPLAFKPHLKTTLTPQTSYIQVEREVEVEVDEDDSKDASPADGGEVLLSDENEVEKPRRYRKELRRFMQEVRTDAVHHDYAVDMEDLKIFVNAGEWSLGASTPSLPRELRQRGRFPAASGASHDNLAEAGDEPRTLHFLLFVPSAKHAPLRIRDPRTGNFSSSKSWVIPQWGGVVLLDRKGIQSSEANDLHGVLPEQSLVEAVTLWNIHLRALLGLPRSAYGLSQATSASANPTVTSFEVDLLGIARIKENIRNSIETLDSIIKLVDKLQNLGVDKTVQADFRQSIACLNQIEERLSSTLATVDCTDSKSKLSELLQLSSDASRYASHSFFNPLMITQLYFPDEHKYAVYTPLFGPVSVPIIVALLKELKGRLKQRKQRQNQVPKDRKRQ
ncbi:hypothetical protein K437DRAFT_258029 [Tilletiaria anomala UBC 951]|uniref:GPI transamidase component PIG-S n=1 Tax=Tilletiaria anomala (strain ATCC 24038 / CBS 436.72 / UBC 951) TaxID=1037660 RepID=A0A066VTF1_TILAU|nr:uncharacterized protein K437DRAFT_258029 [Tilletiaria anomala UBC 951]KDN42089.1 hypothetical protein K437DRAFT_258029 [Tilletiaria anomala UBC 951]